MMLNGQSYIDWIERLCRAINQGHHTPSYVARQGSARRLSLTRGRSTTTLGPLLKRLSPDPQGPAPPHEFRGGGVETP